MFDARNIRSRRLYTKLDIKNIGPFEIIKIVSKVAYELALPVDLSIHSIFYIELLYQANTDPRLDN